jgi:RNA 3'-terminal phosphate cyclase (ATP)
MDVPVAPHQADQLVLSLALAGAGRFRTSRPTLHLRTQLALIPGFLPVRCATIAEERGATRIEVTPA